MTVDTQQRLPRIDFDVLCGLALLAVAGYALLGWMLPLALMALGVTGDILAGSIIAWSGLWVGLMVISN